MVARERTALRLQKKVATAGLPKAARISVE
jgi:hypothetical protein